MTSTLRGHGLALSVHAGWEARIWMPGLPPPAENHPVVRLANFALPLVHTAWITAIAFTVLNAVLLLAVRIPCENRALASVEPARA